MADHNQEGAGDRAERPPKKEPESSKFQENPRHGIDAGFAFRGHFLEVSRKENGVAALRTLRRRPSLGAQVWKGLAAMAASAGENVAAQAGYSVAGDRLKIDEKT